ncbi:MAG: TetR/AcrR family transcriptional regulator [Candidatus Binatia bacterium]|nr:TetR/AcrR family transcriptional regulator [Candidatus Binatia bacterium]
MATLPTPAASLGGRRERRRRELRERVVESALRLVAEQGFEATTVEQIAAAADIAPATFFNHFQSKSGLLSEITGDVAEALETLIGQHLGAEGTVRQQVEGLALHAAEMISEHQKVSREVMLEMLRSGSRPEDAAPYMASLHRPLSTMLAAGQDRGEVRADQDAEFLAEMVLGAFHATVSQWLSDEKYPIAERLPRAASFIWDAIRAGSAGEASNEK